MDFFADRIVIRRAGLVDAGYTRHRDWDHPVVVYAGAASIQPATEQETTVDRETASSTLTVYLPRPAAIDPADRFDYRGIEYEIDGRGQDWHFGSLRHTKLTAWRLDHA